MKKLIEMASLPETKKIIPVLRAKVEQMHNELHDCPFCSSPIHDVGTIFNSRIVRDCLFPLVKWCERTGKHEFDISTVKHLIDKTQYANLNHLVYTDGIMYRPTNPKTGKPYTSKIYGIHLERAHEFFRGERKALVRRVRSRFTGERVEEEWAFIGDFPNIHEFLDEYGNYVSLPPRLL